jgi:hypothetical protein
MPDGGTPGQEPQVAIWVSGLRRGRVRPDIAATRVRAWEPLPRETIEGLLGGRRAQPNARAGEGIELEVAARWGTPPADTILPDRDAAMQQEQVEPAQPRDIRWSVDRRSRRHSCS